MWTVQFTPHNMLIFARLSPSGVTWKCSLASFFVQSTRDWKHQLGSKELRVAVSLKSHFKQWSEPFWWVKSEERKKKKQQQRKSENFFFLFFYTVWQSADALVCGWALWNSAVWTSLTLSSIQSNGLMTLYWPRHSLKRLDFSSHIHLDFKLMSDVLCDGQKQAGKRWYVTMWSGRFVWCQWEFHNEAHRFQGGCFQREWKWDWGRLSHFDLRSFVVENSWVWRPGASIGKFFCWIAFCSLGKKAASLILFIRYKLHYFQFICDAMKPQPTSNETESVVVTSHASLFHIMGSNVTQKHLKVPSEQSRN